MTEPNVTPRSFDRAVRAGRSERIIWTLGAIGQRIGVGPDFVRDNLAKHAGLAGQGDRWAIFRVRG